MPEVEPFAHGWPGIAPRWTSSAKSGIGTAVSRDSRVWFTLSHGILNEIYYPRVDHACTREQIDARLRAHPLIYAARVGQCQQIVDSLSGLDLLPTRLITTGDLELAKTLVLAGLGTGILPRRVADYGHPGELVVLHASLPEIPDRICLCFRADAHRTTAWLRTKTALLGHAKRIAPIPGD